MLFHKTDITKHSAQSFSSSTYFHGQDNTVISYETTNAENKCLTEMIRVSSGTAIALGLIDGFLNAKPTTAYLLTYIEGKCTANCGFCSQAKSSKSRADMLSRVAWPVFATKQVVSKLATAVQRGEIKRVCIQALNYPTVLEDLLALVKEIKLQGTKVPISISCQPLSRKAMRKLADAGVERVGISLDAATKDVFNRVKGSAANGPYEWNRQRDALLEAVEVFGKRKVSTHLIVGLGETEEEMIKTIQWCVDNNIYPALFSFTPILGTALEHKRSPTISHYRRIQLARYLIVQGKTRFEKMNFNEKSCIVDFGVSQEQLETAIRSGTPFLTSGCPNCNRPYYNEKPSGPLYNFPIQPTLQNIGEIKQQLISNS
ncbi:MAG: radical SAM protein [Candidatus Bathyarchaeia archaeon]